ncbi:MAG: hypothetical protein ACE5EH_00115 [Gammaproteobacteria bacterium]
MHKSAISSLKLYFASLLLLVAVISGCGGGGFSDNTSGSTGVAPTITAANAATVAGTAVAAMDVTISSSDFGANTVSVLKTNRTETKFNLSGFSKELLITLNNSGWQNHVISSTVFASAVTLNGLPCDISGTIDMDWNDADNNLVFSANDTFTITFNNCVDATSTANGTASLTGFNLTGDPSLPGTIWSMTSTFTFTNLQITEAGETISTNGSMRFNSASTNGALETATITTSSLTITDGSETVILDNLTIDTTLDTNTLATTLTFNGVVDSSIDGRVTVTTITTLQGLDTDDYPGTGAIKVSGANNTSVTLTAVDNTNVRLAVDADGDGITDSTINTTWTALENT